MYTLVVLFGLLSATLGLVALVSPRTVTRFARRWLSQDALIAVGLIRFVFGIAVIGAAPASRGPLALRAIGCVLVIAGLLTPLAGVDRTRHYLDWWSSQPMLIRVLALLVLAISGLTLTAVMT